MSKQNGPTSPSSNDCKSLNTEFAAATVKVQAEELPTVGVDDSAVPQLRRPGRRHTHMQRALHRTPARHKHMQLQPNA
eukprot:CAMPEP_0171105690 /NCGR_PEP_ID=MMETSP0766_2-20121228/63231_1 /TAXON_ID=439317 /ORGANISM="Gambierdiscus australes, Strain CAWD 149" /LENGTH=77 /DNA_ID=CAMNT_0011566613 /DNA_START=42 /DNA_END=272 /DNA_ORIENTATION=+